MIRRVPFMSLLVVLGGWSLCGCTSSASPGTAATNATLTVAASFYPIEEIVRQVGGADVEVIDLTPPGGEPHDLEVSAQSVSRLEQADIIFYLGRGFQPAVEQLLSSLPGSVKKIDLLDSVQLLPVTPQLSGTVGSVAGEALAGDLDPHVWVDPVNMATMTSAVQDALAAAAPAVATAFAANAERYAAALNDLDAAFSAALATCESRTIVTSHRAFEYLAQRYDLTQIPIAGISPDEEPDAKSLNAVAKAAKEFGVTVVFYEERVPKDLANTIADEVGASTAALDPVETITSERLAAGDSYISVQRENLAALTSALRCKG